MSERFEIFRVLSEEWPVVAEGRRGRRAVWAWGQDDLALAGMHSLAEVVAVCNRRGDAARSASILRALVVRAGDPLASRAVLQALVPGLVRLVSRVERQYGCVGPEGAWPSVADVASDVVGSAVEVIGRLAGREVVWPQTVILDGVWHRVEGMTRRWRRRRAGQMELTLVEAEAHPAEQLWAVLRVAIETGLVTRSEAELVWRFRVEDEPSATTAEAKGCSVVALRKRRERVEQRLVALGHAG